MKPPFRIPTATYRFQMNRDFGFERLSRLVSYLRRLGVSDAYLSPILMARPGSAHGYDGVDPRRLNPELGSPAEFDMLCDELNGAGLGILLDIVPNHLAVSPENPFWMKLLEFGEETPFFDIRWEPLALPVHGQVILPVLGKPYAECLRAGELKFSVNESGFHLNYYDHRFPLAVKSYGRVLAAQGGPFAPEAGYEGEFHAMMEALRSLKTADQAREAKARFFDYFHSHYPFREFIFECVSRLNEVSRPQSLAAADAVLEGQLYRLSFWKTGSRELNYRRFFNINELIGVHAGRDEVFTACHGLIRRFVEDGRISGVRVDHIDGLYEPRRYLERLQEYLWPKGRGAERGFVVVEKILGASERLPGDWPVSGTTGYEFARVMTELFIHPEGIRALGRFYRTVPRLDFHYRETFAQTVIRKKRLALKTLFPGESSQFMLKLLALMKRDREGRDLDFAEAWKAFQEATVLLPVYRTYLEGGGWGESDRRCLKETFREARRLDASLDAEVIAYLERRLLLEFPPDYTDEFVQEWKRFLKEWQQLTGPVMAKGYEDTALYNYPRLIALNDVGGEPDSEGMGLEAFHEWNRERLKSFPRSLNASSTHDTKRSEDVRARIAALSEIPDAWRRHVNRWRREMSRFKPKIGGVPVPDIAEEMQLYQTLAGAWPFSDSELPPFKARLKEYLTKALREAKGHTQWGKPDPLYEKAVHRFAEALLRKSSLFAKSFKSLKGTVAFYGALNSLSQLLLKATSPGVPDFYQGNELWDLSLVDPDNRRPVDYGRRLRLLEEIERGIEGDRLALIERLLKNWTDGAVKLYVTRQTLACRRECREIFEEGDYQPLYARGKYRELLIAFIRNHGKRSFLTVAPRFFSRLSKPGKFPLGAAGWKGGRLPLPKGYGASWKNVFTGETIRSGDSLDLVQVFNRFPVALFMSQEEGALNPRSDERHARRGR